MGARRLPVAPRPFRDETLSSWLGRVACRYGLDAPALAACLASPDDPFDAPRPPIDDISPSSGQIALWARAAAVDPARLRRMTLAERHPRRPLAWFLNRGLAATRPVMPRPPSPVCLACFDADRAAGHDGYCRASWRLAGALRLPGAWPDVDRPMSELPWTSPGRVPAAREPRASGLRALRGRARGQGRGGRRVFARHDDRALGHAGADRCGRRSRPDRSKPSRGDRRRPVVASRRSRRIETGAGALGFRARLARAGRGAPGRRPAHAVGAVAGSRSRPDPRRHSRPLRRGGHGAGRGAGAGRLAVSTRRVPRVPPPPSPLGLRRFGRAGSGARPPIIAFWRAKFSRIPIGPPPPSCPSGVDGAFWDG